MEEHRCEKCTKVFTMKKNLNQHIRSVHEEQKLHECGICQKKFARKQHKELHLKTCSMKVQGGMLRSKSYKPIANLKFSPMQGKTAFGGVFADWMIEYPDDYRLVDPIVLLRESVQAMKDIILDHNKKHTKRLKFTMSIHVVFEYASDPEVKTEPSVVLTTAPFTIYLATDIDESLKDATEKLYKMIEDYEGCGSGWVIAYLERLDTSITSFKAL